MHNTETMKRQNNKQTDTNPPKKRKRGGHNSACWICQRDHRACDVSRPCKRCVSIGCGDECANPPPKKPEQRPKRRKFFMVTTDNFSSTTKTCESIPEPRMSTPTVPVEEPQAASKLNQFSGWQWQQVPQVSNVTTTHHYVDETRRKKPTATMSQPHQASLDMLQSIDKDQERLLITLLQEVQQLNETTGRLKQEQNIIGKQLSALQRSKPAQGADCSMRRLLEEPLDSHEQVRSPEFESLEGSPTFWAGAQPQPEELFANTYTPSHKELVHNTHKTHHPEFSLALDYVRFAESMFLPFVVEDTSKPFSVIKPVIQDGLMHQKLFEALSTTKLPTRDFFYHVIPSALRMFLLHGSQAWCKLVQYDEEEVLGFEAAKLQPDFRILPTVPNLDFIRLLGRQRPGVRVSSAVIGQPTWKAKDGTLIEATAKVQFFYDEEGRPSFGVGSVQSYRIIQEKELLRLDGPRVEETEQDTRQVDHQQPTVMTTTTCADEGRYGEGLVESEMAMSGLWEEPLSPPMPFSPPFLDISFESLNSFSFS